MPNSGTKSMIFQSTNQPHARPKPDIYYAPVDPKYLCVDWQSRPRNSSIIPYKGRNSGEYGLEQLMIQRSEILRSKIGMVASEIYQRRRLKEDNLYRINLDQCTCRNLINLLAGDRGQLDFERKIIELEQEKRKEQTSYFRDVLFLRKELRESLIEKLEEEQKVSMLTNETEGWT